METREKVNNLMTEGQTPLSEITRGHVLNVFNHDGKLEHVTVPDSDFYEIRNDALTLYQILPGIGARPLGSWHWTEGSQIAPLSHEKLLNGTPSSSREKQAVSSR